MRSALVALSVAVALQGYGFQPPNPARIAEIAALLPEKPGIPAAHITNRVNWDRLAATPQGKGAIRNAAGRMKADIPACPDELYLEFSTPGNGNRTHYEKPFFAREYALSALVLGECLENKGRFVPRICDYLNVLCGERTWCMPAHDSKKLEAFHGLQQRVDLGAQSRALACALAVDLLRGKLPEDVSRRTLSELERRIFAPLRPVWAVDGPRRGISTWWFQGRANWTAVCHSGVTRAALAVLEDRNDRAAFVEAAERSVPTYLSGFTDDGYCSEGMGYWNYGWGNFLALALAVREATGGKVDFCASEKAKTAMSFGTGALLFGMTAPSFADGGGALSSGVQVLGHLIWPDLPVVEKARTRVPLRGGIADAVLLDFGQWEKVPAPGDTDYPIRTAFPFAQMWVLRPGAGDMPFRLGLKGGHNDEFHNHNDVGSYTLFLDEQWLTGDAGGTQYTAKTFGPHRYEIAMISSYGHPLPVVNGALQAAGRKYAAKVVSTEFTDARDTVVLDLTGAYEASKAKLRSLVRTFVYDRAEKAVSVSDRVTFEGEGTFSVPLVTAGTLTPTDRPGVYALAVPARAKGGKSVAASVAVAADGADYALTSERIENPPRLSPDRYAFTLKQPVKTATVTLRFSR